MTDVKEELAQTLFDHIPVGVGSQGIISTSAKDLEAALEMGMDWSLREVSPLPPPQPACLSLAQGVLTTQTQRALPMHFLVLATPLTLLTCVPLCMQTNTRLRVPCQTDLETACLVMHMAQSSQFL